MNRKTTIPMVMVIMILSLLMSGCGPTQIKDATDTPEKTYILASENYNMLIERYTVYKDEQPTTIFNEWTEDIDPLIIEGGDILDVWEGLLKAKDYDQAERTSDEFLEFKNTLIDLVAEKGFDIGGE